MLERQAFNYLLIPVAVRRPHSAWLLRFLWLRWLHLGPVSWAGRQGRHLGYLAIELLALPTLAVPALALAVVAPPSSVAAPLVAQIFKISGADLLPMPLALRLAPLGPPFDVLLQWLSHRQLLASRRRAVPDSSPGDPGPILLPPAAPRRSGSEVDRSAWSLGSSRSSHSTPRRLHSQGTAREHQTSRLLQWWP